MPHHSRFFDRHARDWDSNKTPGELKKLKELLGAVGIRKGEKILDAGCGTGCLFPILLEYTGSEGSLSAVDISEEMLRVAKKKFKGKKINYFLAPAKDLPVENNCFDRIVSYSSFPHFQDKKKVLREFARVLKEGGRVHIIHSSSREEINSHHMKVGGEVKNDHLPGKKRMEILLAGAGFVNIDIKENKDSYAVSAVLSSC